MCGGGEVSLSSKDNEEYDVNDTEESAGALESEESGFKPSCFHVLGIQF